MTVTQDNPQAAQKLVLIIKGAVSLLSEQPGIGRPGRIPNTKEFVVDHSSYILPYRVRDNKIEILRVLHATRRWPQKPWSQTRMTD
ncbi:MAG: type II toxin-antitoxin system RelE/ParE family toxin [Gammaproteobacteria bacterium]|nr:type II toxin-antitoxin system RelE/ParE family toxin [Gammaproteobacteria bacterium]MCF6362075.1 type II toxin-antitoxin system RelE/ParE family toxin [Gammaproteobacteria bacterium]